MLDGTGVWFTQVAMNSDIYSVFDEIPATEHAAIMARTSTYDATADIQRAIDHAVSLRRDLSVPGGVYTIVPTLTFNAEGGTCARAFAIRSGMHIRAEKGAIFRIRDGVSTDAAPKFMCMFGTNEVLSDVSWRGLTMDMNGPNNPISPNRDSGVYSLFNQAMIFVSGTPGAVFTGSISGSVLTVNGMVSGVIAVAQRLNFSGITAALSIVSQASGAPGGVGTYNLNGSVDLDATTIFSGVAARIDRAVVEGCTFTNTPGTGCLVMAQSNTLGVRLGEDWTVTDNRFFENGYDTPDHSSVYGWAEGVLLERNQFANETQHNGVGGNVAFEVHGSNTRFISNIVRKYYQGNWIDGNFTRLAEHILIADNLYDQIGGFGALFFGHTPTAQTRNVKISRNTWLPDDSIQSGVGLKIGFGLTTIVYGQSEVEIVDNVCRASITGTAACAVAVTAPTLAGELHDKVWVERNTSYGTTFGELVKTNATCGLGFVSVRGNKRYNLSPAGSFSLPFGLFVSFDGATASQIDQLVVDANQCVDNRGASAECAFGTYVEGTIGRFDYGTEVFRGMTNGTYVEASPTITTRKGDFETSVAYDPPSLASGAKGSIQTATLPGASLGDLVQTAFSVDLAGAKINAWVSDANTVSYYFANDNGANPLDLSGGTLRLRVTKS